MFEWNTEGASRSVVLTRRWALKFPKIHRPCSPYGYAYDFLTGLRSNLCERVFWRMRLDAMCPVTLSLPFGIMNIMPRCRPLTASEWECVDHQSFVDQGIPVENKRSSFGWYQNRIVALDYGS